MQANVQDFDLIQEVKDGAKLRLRPIMWSNRQGAEIMMPLATPVIGGMISSLIHILIATPVIFLWMHERQLKKGTLQASLSNENVQP